MGQKNVFIDKISLDCISQTWNKNLYFISEQNKPKGRSKCIKIYILDFDLLAIII